MGQIVVVSEAGAVVIIVMFHEETKALEKRMNPCVKSCCKRGIWDLLCCFF